MEGGVTGQPFETPYFHPRHRYPPFVWKSVPLVCVVSPQKSIFCCADFGSTIALDHDCLKLPYP